MTPNVPELDGYRPRPEPQPEFSGPPIDEFHYKSSTPDIPYRLIRKAFYLVTAAWQDTSAQLSPGADKTIKEKARNAIDRQLLHYVLESEAIAEQFQTPEFKTYVEDEKNFLGTGMGIVVCSDGRILTISLCTPKVAHVYRRPGGEVPMREVVHKGVKVSSLADTSLESATKFAVLEVIRKKEEILEKTTSGELTGEERTRAMQEYERLPVPPNVTIFYGSHINSGEPEEGCGALKAKSIPMDYGGAEEYFAASEDVPKAFAQIITTAGGKEQVWSLAHDIYSQGIIMGLQEALQRRGGFDRSKSLRDNLIDLHQDREILMSELLDDDFRDEIMAEYRRQGHSGQLDIRNPYRIAKNAMIIGRVTMEIIKRHEEQGFPWIPDCFKQDDPPVDALRTLAFITMRNSVYRILSGIKPGEHDLLLHPEKLMRVGPTGSPFNLRNIAFIESTSEGELTQDDTEGAQKLLKILENNAQYVGINVENEGLVVVTTGPFNEKDHQSKARAHQEYLRIVSIVNANVNKLREVFGDKIATGEIVVVGMIYERGTRKILSLSSTGGYTLPSDELDNL